MLFDSVDVVEDRLGMVCLLSEIGRVELLGEVVESVLLSGIDTDGRSVDIAGVKGELREELGGIIFLVNANSSLEHSIILCGMFINGIPWFINTKL